MTLDELKARQKHSQVRFIQGGNHHLTAEQRSKILILSDLYKRKKNSDVVGIELNGTTWRNIDALGNDLDNFYVKQSPCLTGIHDVTVDGQAMVQIPKFYFLYNNNNGVQRWWIADRDFTINGVGRAQVHKGFVYRGVVEPAFQIGAYEASADPNDNNKTASVFMATPQGNISYNDMVSHCINRGNNFHMLNIWQNGAVQLLCLIEAGQANVKSIFGAGNTKQSSSTDRVMLTGTSSANWRGIHDLYSNTRRVVTGCAVLNSVYSIINDTGGSDLIPTSAKLLTSGSSGGWRYVSKFSDYFLKHGLFLPETYSTSNNAFSTLWGGCVGWYYGTTNNVFCRTAFGAHVTSSHSNSVQGLFSTCVNTFGSDAINSYRLARYIHLDPIPNNDVIGIELDGAAWRNIDATGNPLSYPFVKGNTVLTGIHDIEVDGQAMVQIPKYHFLYQQTPTGHRWWVADHEFTIDGVGTSSVHKGFIYNGVEKPAFQVGAYECSQDLSDSNKNASIIGATPRVNVTYDQHVTYCANRGNGFHMINVWQNAAVKLLCLIDAGQMYVQEKFGVGNTSNIHPSMAESIAKCGATNAVWRGIHEFWGNIRQLVQGVQRLSNTYHLTADAGTTTLIDTGITVPMGAVWKYITGFSVDLFARGLFLTASYGDSDPGKWGKSVTWTNNPDAQYKYISFGGHPSDITNIESIHRGPFSMCVPQQIKYIVDTTRLARPVDESEVTA